MRHGAEQRSEACWMTGVLYAECAIKIVLRTALGTPEDGARIDRTVGIGSIAVAYTLFPSGYRPAPSMSIRHSPFLFAIPLLTFACGTATVPVVPTPEPQATPKGISTSDAGVRFGSSHGMCMGYCTTEYELSDDGLMARRRGGGRGDTAAYPMQQQFIPLDKAAIDAVMARLDGTLFDAAPDVIGCPDCADGGRCWVEVLRNGTPRTITFDCSSGSDRLTDFTTALWQLADRVSWADGR